MGATNDFNELFDDFQSDEFFQDAIYPFFWDDVENTIDRVTGDRTSSSIRYECDVFLVNPSKSERPSNQIFKDIQIGDIAIVAQQNELIVRPALDSVVNFNGSEYICKEVVPDPVNVTWKMLLRN